MMTESSRSATWKHVAVLVATVLAFGVSMLMMQRAVGIASPWMALMAIFCFLGLAKVVDPVYALKVPASIRDVRAWELRGAIYRKLGVPAFGALLRNTPLRVLNTTVYVAGNRRDPLRIRRQLESAEAAHFWAAMLMMPYLAWCALSGKWAVFGAFLALQIMLNVYPILHLRSVRGRVDRVRRKNPSCAPRASRGQIPDHDHETAQVR
jgi:hypothetical protein